MNKISFGKVIYPPACQERTMKQTAIQDVIENIFNLRHQDLPISTVVHRNLRADILVKHLKNGNTEIKFIKSKKPQNVKYSEKYINDNIGGCVLSHRDDLSSICDKLEKFADKCVDAAKNYYMVQ